VYIIYIQDLVIENHVGAVVAVIVW